MNFAVYLRKSRADIEAEARGEGETLARHEHTLSELAEKRGLNITATYKEIASGESIAARPCMQKLLSEVSAGKYGGVLVMEIERLARGNTIDQGVVAQAFKDSGTKIITPQRDYDPNDEFDEEYFEFGLFMSRREYKTIRRRMNAGRLAAVREGNYIVSSRPYGYRKCSPAPKIHTLEIIPEEAEAVKFIFRSFLCGKSACAIAGELNAAGIQPMRSCRWGTSSVRKILSNPLYAGKLRWKAKGAGHELFDGIHEPLISYDDFLIAHDMTCPAAPKTKNGKPLRNCYQGLLYCGNCGRPMILRASGNGKYTHLLCRNAACRGSSASIRADKADALILAGLRQRLLQHDIPALNVCAGAAKERIDAKKRMLGSEREKLLCQRDKLRDLLETGVYNAETYLARTEMINSRLKKCGEEIADTEEKLAASGAGNSRNFSMEEVISLLENTDDPEAKNMLLKTVIGRIDYIRPPGGKGRRTEPEITVTLLF